ncbi:hypothetical protein [Maribacter sp. 2210JD10-5]
MHDVFQILDENADLSRDASEFIADLKRFSFKAHTIFYLKRQAEFLFLGC